MKHIRIPLICLLLAALLAGCSLPKHPGNKVAFYYSRTEFAYGKENPVILSEKRDIAGHEDDLKYILSLYLMGPLDEELTPVFPVTTRQVGITQEGNTLTVHLTPIAKTLSEMEFSLACSCLTMTCMELTECAAVTIICGERSVTLTKPDLLLSDNPVPPVTQLEETK